MTHSPTISLQSFATPARRSWKMLCSLLTSVLLFFSVLLNRTQSHGVANALDGYYVIRQYTDQSCNDLLMVDGVILNTCISENRNTSIMFTANSTSKSVSYYRDPECSIITDSHISSLQKGRNHYSEEAVKIFPPVPMGVTYR